MMYVLMISVILMVLSVAIIVFKHTKNNTKISMEYVFLVLGIIGFMFSIVNVANRVNTLGEQNAVLIAYFVDHNCTDKDLDNSIKLSIIKYKVDEYSKTLKLQNQKSRTYK